MQILGQARYAIAFLVVVDPRHLEQFGDERATVLTHAAVDLHVGHRRARFVEGAVPRRHVHICGVDQGAVDVQEESAVTRTSGHSGR
ncbi:hypothetical protein GCM10022294_08840 [Dietzia aurantiaca]